MLHVTLKKYNMECFDWCWLKYYWFGSGLTTEQTHQPEKQTVLVFIYGVFKFIVAYS